MDDNGCKACTPCDNVSITCLLVCSPHNARPWDALKSACKNVIFKHHALSKAGLVNLCSLAQGFPLMWDYLLFFPHVHAHFMTWRCLIRFCAVCYIVVISGNRTRTHPLQNICIQTTFAIAESIEPNVTTFPNQAWRFLYRCLYRDGRV